MSMNITSPNYQSIINQAREDLKKIENKGVSKAETLEDLRDTKGKSFRTSDLEKLMEKYDPEAYAKYNKFSKSADGSRTQEGLSFLSKWMDSVKAGLKNGTISSYNITSTSKKTTETSSTARKTSTDELAYLSKKFKNYSFIAANYSTGMRYGSNSTVNAAISPQFLAKMANDPELEAYYEKQIAGMQECDEQNARSVAAGGWHIVAQGWAIDKNGGISKWSITEKDDKKSLLQNISEDMEKIRTKSEEKKKAEKEAETKCKSSKEEKAKLQKKIEKTGRKKFGDKFKGAAVMEKDDENAAVIKESNKNNTVFAGTTLDIKA